MISPRSRLVVGIVVIGAGALGWWTYHRQSAPAHAQRIVSDPAAAAARIEEDRKRIADPATPDGQRFSSMMSLATRRDPKALEVALGYVEKEKGPKRIAGINTLGFFEDDKVIAKLEQLLKDRDVTARVQALTSLGFRAGPKREAILNAVVARKDISEVERVQAIGSLHRVIAAPEAKKELIGKLIAASSAAKTDDARNRATSLLIGLAPRDERVIAYSKGIAEAGKPGFAVTLARRHLSSIKQ